MGQHYEQLSKSQSAEWNLKTQADRGYLPMSKCYPLMTLDAK